MNTCIIKASSNRKMVTTPATCGCCGLQFISPTTGVLWNECTCGGTLIPNSPSAPQSAIAQASADPRATQLSIAIEDLADDINADRYSREAAVFYWRCARWLLLACFCSLLGISLGAMIVADYRPSALAAISAIAVLGIRAILHLH